MAPNFPTQARVVIIGGGIMGCSTAYHLAKLGWKDVVLLEQGRLSGGTTWHAAGLVGQLRSSQNLSRLIRYSTELYSKLEAETGLATGWKQCGSLTVARSEERMMLLRRSVAKSTPPRLERVRMGSFVLDLPRRLLLDQAGNDVPLTSGEFDVLKIFAENPNQPLGRDWLLETTSHRSRDPFDRAIDLRITRIRRKIEPMHEKPTVIRTVRGIGYMFVPPAE